MRKTEHGQHFYIHMDTTFKGMRMQMWMPMWTADYAYMDFLPKGTFTQKAGVERRAGVYQAIQTYNLCLHILFVLLGSVLFRTSVYTGAKQARRVPTGSKQDNSSHHDDVKDVSVLLESELISPV